jgi:hypothetical protein
MKSLIKLFVFVVFFSSIATSVFAFASSRSGPHLSGEGVAEIHGWVISNVSYELAEEPIYIDSVGFDLNAAANRVSVKIDSRSTAFTSCLNTNGYHWQCAFPAGTRVSSMDEFRVVAVGN